MPYRHEHAARQEDPINFGTFRRVTWGKGISVIYGIPKSRVRTTMASLRSRKKKEPIVVQSIRFDASLWSVEEAKEWLKSHGYKTRIVPASEPPKKRLTEVDLDDYEGLIELFEKFAPKKRK